MGILSRLKKMLEPSPEVIKYREMQDKITDAFNGFREGFFNVKNKEDYNSDKSTVLFESRKYPNLKLEIFRDLSRKEKPHAFLTTKDGKKIDLLPHANYSDDYRILEARGRFARPSPNWDLFFADHMGNHYRDAKYIDENNAVMKTMVAAKGRD